MLVAMRCPVVSAMLQYSTVLRQGLSNTLIGSQTCILGRYSRYSTVINYLDEAFQALFVTVHGRRLFGGQPQLSVLLIWVLDLS
jgi:hypothetical protein